jgi:hypothetical protein
MLEESRELTTNDQLLVDHTDDDPLTYLDGGTYQAAETIGVGSGTYVFCFWTLDGMPMFDDPSSAEVWIAWDTVHTATKWYIKTVPGQPTPETGFTLIAFSMGLNRSIPETPEASVMPPQSLSGNFVDTTNTAVQMTARSAINGEPFDHWWRIGDSTAPSQGNFGVSLAQSASGVEVGFFGFTKVKPPRLGPDSNPFFQFAREVAIDLHRVDPGPRYVPRLANQVIALSKRVELLEKSKR